MAELLKKIPRRKSQVHPDLNSDQSVPITTTEVKFPTNVPQDNSLIAEGCRRASLGQYKEAIDNFNRVLPLTHNSLYYRGCARLKLNEPSEIHEAIEDFNQSLKLIPPYYNLNIYYKRAFACQSIGRYAEAIIDYTIFIDRSSAEKQHIGYLNRGLVYSEIKEYAKALDDINQACERSSQLSKYYVYCLAQAQSFVGNTIGCKTKFQQLAQMCVNEYNSLAKSYETIFYYGIASYELNNYEKASQLFTEALSYIRNNQDRAEIMFYIGLIHYACNHVETAKNDFEQTLQHNPNHARALFRLGLIESQNDKSQTKAMICLTKAHELLPHKSDILYERGELYHKLGQLDACVRDKRLAMQLGSINADSSSLKHCYELLVQQLLAQTKNSIPSDQMSLAITLLYDKIHRLSDNKSRSSSYDISYRQMILSCEREITNCESKNPKYLSIYFALLCSLHKYHKCSGAAMIALDQFHKQLDEKQEFEVYWQEIMQKLRTIKSPVADFDNILEMLQKQISQISSDQEKDRMCLSLLADRLSEFEKTSKYRDQFKNDQESLKADENKNRLIFYESIRINLSHKFASMAVVSGDDYNEPIVQHDKTGTETLVADGVAMLGDFIGNNIPFGGGLVSTAANFTSCALKKDEYSRFQSRMAVVTDVGTIEELADVARQVAWNLAQRYKEQLLCLDSELNNVPIVNCSCVSRKNKQDFPSQNLPKQLAQIAVFYAQRAICDGQIDQNKLLSDLEHKCENLAQIITELICCSEPDIKTKFLKRFGLGKNTILPHKSLRTLLTEGQKADVWYLHEFYYKPAIRIVDGESYLEQLPLSHMDRDGYGFRLGTLEEYHRLKKLDDEKIRKQAESRCC